MNYSILIATRNRLAALELSVPRMLKQSRPPAQLVVVDSSDDHAVIAAALHRMLRGQPLRYTIVQSDRGLTLQRNRGLDLVEEPIVFMPDDDSIWFPGFAEHIMGVYERDSGSRVAAVCGLESRQPPSGFSETASSYQVAASDKLKLRMLRWRRNIENRWFPDPSWVLGRSLMGAADPSAWSTLGNARPVEFMTGFRMTFRTSVAQKVRFESEFRRYSLMEDRDASFGAWRHGAVIAALDARVYHHRAPERRDAGRRLGVEHLLNLGYVIAKHSPTGHPCREGLVRFGRYKHILYLLAARDAFGRERASGARAALKELRALSCAEPVNAPQIYREALNRCLPESNQG